jgi:type II secretory pathway pseudopilin PulG
MWYHVGRWDGEGPALWSRNRGLMMPGTRTPRGSRSAFTLVELLVVVSVIMILMSMVLPALQGAAQKAREVKCLSNLNQLAKAMVTYSVNFAGFLPSPAHVDTTITELNDKTLFNGDRTLQAGNIYSYKSYTWRGKLLPFIGGRTITVPDALKGTGVYFENALDEDDRYGIFKCPSVRDFRGYQSYYGINGYIGMHVSPLATPPVGEQLKDSGGSFKYTHVDDLLDTARTLLIGENQDGHWAVKPKYPRNVGDFVALVGTAVFPGQKFNGEIYFRHSRRTAWVYADGHNESMIETRAHESQCFAWLPEKPQ